jgi:hypothetical protein
MTSSTPAGFLNKKEIETNYGRSYRSLTRDITRAVKSRDANILRHLKLVTEDDRIREGTEVDLDLIQELSNSGLRPMWLAEEIWVADWCLKKATQSKIDGTRIQPQPDSKPRAPITKSATSESVDLYHQRIHDLETHNELLVGQLKIKNDQIRAANQQAEQSQQLMRDLHVLLKNVQDGLLGEGRPLIAAPNNLRTSEAKSIAPHNVKENPKRAAEQGRGVEPAEPSQPIIRGRRRAKSKKNDGHHRSKPAMPGAVKKQSKSAKQKSPAENAGPLQRWLPTFFGSKR